MGITAKIRNAISGLWVRFSINSFTPGPALTPIAFTIQLNTNKPNIPTPQNCPKTIPYILINNPNTPKTITGVLIAPSPKALLAPIIS